MISREQMQHNAAMNTQMTERFNVAGAVLVKLFGSLDRDGVEAGFTSFIAILPRVGYCVRFAGAYLARG